MNNCQAVQSHVLDIHGGLGPFVTALSQRLLICRDYSLMADLKGWRIAKIHGVDVKIHISLLLLLPYLVLITAARFTAIAQEVGINPALLSIGPFAWGLILAVALFLSVLLHEFGHSLVAQSMGIHVNSITLMMLGGVSNMEKMPERPYAEFKMSVVGPHVSFAIAGAMYGVEKVAQSPNLIFFAHWVSRVNFILGVFNLIPAFPLDGGRALRSLLAVKRSQIKATEVAVRVSTVFAWALGFLGLFGFNIILMLIAFFIYSAARSEYALLVSKGLLKDVHASDVIVRTPVLNDRLYIGETANRMIDSQQTVLPVAVAPEKAAVISLAQIRRIPRQYWDTTAVKDLMLPVTRILNMQDHLGEIIPDLATSPLGVLPVRDDGSIVGIVRYSDLNDLLELRSLKEKPDEPADGKKRAA